MTLLVSFLCRFGWGMAVGLLLTPSSDVPAGFFRVNLLVVMGLATLAAAARQRPGRWASCVVSVPWQRWLHGWEASAGLLRDEGLPSAARRS